jgi:hypothetical protein
MEENNEIAMDERTLLLNRAVGVSLILIGVYGLLYAYKIYKSK